MTERPSDDLTNIIRLSFSGPHKGAARPGDHSRESQSTPYRAYECCTEKQAPLSAFRILIPECPTWHVPYHQLRDFESTETGIHLKTLGYTYDLQGFALDNEAFFDALAEQRIRLIRQWDPLRRARITDGQMWITNVQRLENRPRKEETAEHD